MQLEFHQLDRRWEHLRVRHLGRQRRLLAWLADSGQQTPIVVVAAEGQADRYVVIDGYQRIAALEQLGRDTVEAVVWPMAGGAELSYAAVTAFCRRHGIGYAPPTPAGQYDFAPGEEMQHDTSPHELELGGKKRRVQTASAVLCYSRMLFFQCYPTFRRFDCKVFLSDAVRYMGGAATRVSTANRCAGLRSWSSSPRRRISSWSGKPDGAKPDWLAVCC